ncbi:hypothetical protein Q8F55_000484 [Vanrija albida]|uniref:Uncharacterized protein n=1 Tax=Vanrija albida TaxID=181172 RepID=A0ABR3QDL0_9TREE
MTTCVRGDYVGVSFKSPTPPAPRLLTRVVNVSVVTRNAFLLTHNPSTNVLGIEHRIDRQASDACSKVNLDPHLLPPP